MCTFSAFKPLLLSLTLFLVYALKAQNNISTVNPAPFADAAHHWYDINDKHAVIQPTPGHPKHKPSELEAIGNNILLYQKSNGGWPKNYDIFAILTPAQKDTLKADKQELNTTIDNGTSYTHVEALAHIYAATRKTVFRDAAVNGLDYLLKAQYPNGGWPQYYPLQNNYSRHITYNDDAMAGVMHVFKDICEGDTIYNFIDTRQRKKIQAAFNNGINCILKTQIRENGVTTAWCQQHDEKTLAPAWARKFEPPSICNGESVKIVLLLMSLKNPSPAVINAVEQTIAWFQSSAIQGIKVETIKAPEVPDGMFGQILKTDKVVVTDQTAPLIWARYYELNTHRPLFCNRDSKVVYSLAEVERERRVGYAWYTYAPQKVLDLYPSWRKKNNL